jgi:hypothetical protein
MLSVDRAAMNASVTMIVLNYHISGWEKLLSDAWKKPRFLKLTRLINLVHVSLVEELSSLKEIRIS